MEMLIGVMIVTWFLKNAVVDAAHAVRGQDSPRLKQRLAELAAAKSNGGVVPRVGASGYFADLWTDAWTGASSRRATKMAGAKPQRTPWFQRPGARGFFARRWSAAWDRFDAKFTPPAAQQSDSASQRDDSWLERVVDGTYDDAPKPSPSSAGPRANRERAADVEHPEPRPPSSPASRRSRRATTSLNFATDSSAFSEVVRPGELSRGQKAAVNRISQILEDADGKPVDESVIVADLAERGIDREDTIAALDFMTRIGHIGKNTVKVTDPVLDSDNPEPDTADNRGVVPPRMPVGTPPEDLREAVNRIRRVVEEANGEEVSPESLLEKGVTPNVSRQDLLRGLNYLVEGGYLKSTGQRDEALDSNVIPIRPDLGTSPVDPTTPANREDIRNMFIPQTDGTRREAAKAIAEQLVGEMAGQLAALDLLTASLTTEGVKGDIFTVLAGYRDRFAVMDGAATELNTLIDAHGVVTDAYMNSGTQAPRDFVASKA